MAVLFPKTLIESAAPDTLLTVLAGFPGWLSATGCDALPVSTAARSGWSLRLYRAVNLPDHAGNAEHVAVRETLGRIEEMASEDGRERLIVALGEDRTDRLCVERRTDFEVALMAYAVYRDRFELAYARKSSTETVRFLEYFPERHVPISGHHDLATQQAMRDAVAAYYRRRGNTGYAGIDVEDTHEEVRILVLHGRAPRAFNVIDDEEDPVPVRQVHDKHDLIVVDKESGRLGINAQSPREVSMLRSLVGSVFFGDAQHFNKEDIYTGAPLADMGLAALSTAGIPGLASVRLRGLRISARGRRRRIEWTDRDDLSDELDEQYVLDQVQQGEIACVHLGVTHAGQSTMRPLILMPPNKIYFDRRLFDAPVRAFLQRRGFADYPALPRVPRAA